MSRDIIIASRILLSVFVLLFVSASINAQADWQNWNALEIQGNLSKKVDIKAGYLKAYSLTDRYTTVFNQASVRVNYELNKKWDIQGGVQFITLLSAKQTRKRVFARAAYTSRINKKVNWINSVRVETNSQNEYRFRQRIIFTTRLGLRKRLDFLRLTPSISYSLFYNFGGDSIRYYNKEAQLISRQTPDGFHRGRILVNFNSKVNDYLRINLYYMRQQEFNLFSPETRKMNVYDPVRNKTLRPFNNYNTIGLSIQVMINTFF